MKKFRIDSNPFILFQDGMQIPLTGPTEFEVTDEELTSDSELIEVIISSIPVGTHKINRKQFLLNAIEIQE